MPFTTSDPGTSFMPSSNDSLISPKSGSNDHAFETSRSLSYSSSSHEINTHSSSLHRVTSNSPQRNTSAGMPAQSDATYWYHHCQKLHKQHEAERSLWASERKQFVFEREQLEANTRQRRGDSGFASMSGSMDNDKTYFDPAVAAHAKEKLKAMNDISPRGTLSPSQDSNVLVAPKRSGSSVSTGILASISETDDISEKSDKHVKVDQHVETTSNEEPASPPSTAIGPLSPTATNSILHAGHTPLRTRSPYDFSAESNASAAPKPLLTTQTFAPNAVKLGTDDDTELHSPKMLPTVPRKGSLQMLDELGARLEEIVQDPTLQIPEAVRNMTEVEEPPGSDQSTTNTADNGQEAGGIRLKTKRSMNFGAPFGSMRSH